MRSSQVDALPTTIEMRRKQSNQFQTSLGDRWSSDISNITFVREEIGHNFKRFNRMPLASKPIDSQDDRRRIKRKQTVYAILDCLVISMALVLMYTNHLKICRENLSGLS